MRQILIFALLPLFYLLPTAWANPYVSSHKSSIWPNLIGVPCKQIQEIDLANKDGFINGTKHEMAGNIGPAPQAIPKVKVSIEIDRLLYPQSDRVVRMLYASYDNGSTCRPGHLELLECQSGLLKLLFELNATCEMEITELSDSKFSVNYPTWGSENNSAGVIKNVTLIWDASKENYIEIPRKIRDDK